MADCESSGRWDLDTGNSFYGGLQETLRFWQSNGGGPGLPSQHSREEQIEVAERGSNGGTDLSPWPVCRKFG